MIYTDSAGNSLPVGEIHKIETWASATITAIPIEPNRVYRLRASANGVKFRVPYRGDVTPPAQDYTMKADEIIYLASGDADFIQVTTGSDSIAVIVYK